MLPGHFTQDYTGSGDLNHDVLVLEYQRDPTGVYCKQTVEGSYSEVIHVCFHAIVPADHTKLMF